MKLRPYTVAVLHTLKDDDPYLSHTLTRNETNIGYTREVTNALISLRI